MRNAAFIVVAALLVVSANAQDPKTGITTKKVEADKYSRTGRIEAAFQNRVAQQKDYLFDDEGDFPRVIQIIRWECDLRPLDYELWTDLIWMYFNVEDYTNEMGTAIEFRNLQPQNPEAWYPEGDIYFRRREFIKAIPPLETSINLGVPHENSFRLLAQSWNRLGFTKQAIRVWERMLINYPNDQRARAQLERAKASLNQPK